MGGISLRILRRLDEQLEVGLMDYKEKRFEQDIETFLLSQGGYTKGNMSTYDASNAIDLPKLMEFIQKKIGRAHV